ncbi:MAG: ribonuclease H-like domain-containing protein [Ferruginibacter sp.]
MYKSASESLIVIDIETVSEFASYNDLSSNWKKLWEAKIKKNLPEGVSVEQFYVDRAGVMAEFSKIICISIGWVQTNDTPYLRIKSFSDTDEKELLINFIQGIKSISAKNIRWSFGGHNIREFDIPFICRRMLIHSLELPPFLKFQNMKPWEIDVFDTFQYWRFGDYKNYTSLDLLATALSVPTSKDDIDGSMIHNLYWIDDELQKQMNILRIINYCQKDIITTTNIIFKLKNMPLIPKGNICITDNLSLAQ